MLERDLFSQNFLCLLAALQASLLCAARAQPSSMHWQHSNLHTASGCWWGLNWSSCCSSQQQQQQQQMEVLLPSCCCSLAAAATGQLMSQSTANRLRLTKLHQVGQLTWLTPLQAEKTSLNLFSYLQRTSVAAPGLQGRQNFVCCNLINSSYCADQTPPLLLLLLLLQCLTRWWQHWSPWALEWCSTMLSQHLGSLRSPPSHVSTSAQTSYTFNHILRPAAAAATSALRNEHRSSIHSKAKAVCYQLLLLASKQDMVVQCHAESAPGHFEIATKPCKL
jgi:hypothetical protein